MTDKTKTTSEVSSEESKQTIPNGDSVVGTGNDARLALFNSIADENDSLIEEEAASDFEDKSDQQDPQDDNENDDADDLHLSEDENIEENEEDPQEDQPQVSKKFKIKVNGEEVELTEDEVLSRASKVTAADEYLKQAAELKRQAQEERTSQQKQVSQPSPEDVAKSRRDERLALVRAIQMGDEEEALAAVDKLIGSQTSPSFNQDDLSRTVDERLSFQAASSKFKSEYSDILSDPILSKLAIDRDAELKNSGDTRDYWERFQQVGNEIREWKQGILKTAAPEAPVSDPLKNKQQKKAASSQIPTSANRKSSQVVDQEEDDGEENPQEIIAAAAKARGGPQWMRG